MKSKIFITLLAAILSPTIAWGKGGSGQIDCPEASSIKYSSLTEWAAAYPSQKAIIFGRKARQNPNVLKFAIVGHECCHIIHGPDEDTADCCAGKKLAEKNMWNNEMKNSVAKVLKTNGSQRHSPKSVRIANIERCAKQVTRKR